MYRKHKAFDTPPYNKTIRQYISFAKFVCLLAKEALYFSRLDQHDDGWEGLLPRGRDAEGAKYIRFTKYINCWHVNDSESDAMWKLYGPHGETVAIETNVGRLIKSLEKSAEDIYIGKVEYEETNIPEGNLYFPVTYKRKPFQHEKELRLCISSPSNMTPDTTNLRQALIPFGIDKETDGVLKLIGDKGISVRVDLPQLINKVIICPTAKPYLSDSVHYIVKDKVPRARIKNSKI